MTVRVLLADDHGAVRAGLRMILETDPGIEVVGEAADGRVAIDMARALSPDVVLMDLRMPRLDGIEATRALSATTRVVVLTSFGLDDLILGALRAGAGGFLLKDIDADDLIAAVRRAAAGDTVLAPSVTASVVALLAAAPEPPARAELPGDLTDRETGVLRLLAEGLSNQEIATDLRISEATVKTHVSRILTKLGAASRVQAALAYREAHPPEGA